MDRTLLGKKTLNKHRPRVDRFVPPRESISDIKMRLFTVRIFDDNHQDIWNTKYMQRKKYAAFVDTQFSVNSTKYKDNTCNTKQDARVQPWPCIPRKKSFLKSADSILDLPTYSFAVLPELLDWSNDNILVAALGRNYHKWSWQSQNLISRGFTRNKILCCKFDPRSELLALGTEYGIVEMHSHLLSKLVAKNTCFHQDIIESNCDITALDWSPTGNSLIVGCSRGTLTVYTRHLEIVNLRSVSSALYSIKVSPDTRYVAVTAVSGSDALILSWPELNLHSTQRSHMTIKAVRWHPWRSALLGIGGSTLEHDTHIAMYNAPTLKIKQRTIGRNHYSLDAMLFSERTGELVLSLWDTDSATQRRCSQLVVMSDFNTVVDQWGVDKTGLDRVRTMVLSPDGTKLATATADEDLIIWNFLPEDKVTKSLKTKKHYGLAEWLDITTHGYSLR